MSSALRRTALALGAAILTHGLFLAAITTMAVALYDGLTLGRGRLEGWSAFLVNGCLLVQFPLLHSFLLTARGRAVLARLAPRPYGPDFAPSTFAGVASAQVLATFWLWSPTGIVLYEPKGAWLVAFDVAYAASWGLLVKAIADAGVGLQSGSIGWLAVLRGTRPNYGEMPRRGLFLACRQPIYLAYALTLWTGPVRTLDGLLLAVPWTAYCYFGPRLKERRYEGWFGEAFVKYRSEVPYFLPRIRRSASKSLPSKESA